MPSSIPYDPSLVLGNLVQEPILDNLLEVAQLQAPIDAKHESLNSLIMMNRSLNMTMNELSTMGIQTNELQSEIASIGTQIETTAGEYGKLFAEAAPKIAVAKSKHIPINKSIESPIDYNRTQIKKMPLSSDSIKMDAQYFSFDENKENAQNTIAQIKSYIAGQTSFLGNTRSLEATNSVSKQVNTQVKNHNLEGTLIITAACTHKDAVLLAPFILDVDKGIRVWNTLKKEPLIKVDDPATMMKIAVEEGSDKESNIQLISGATYGSSFVGMVHVLRTESTQTSQNMIHLAGTLQGQMEVGSWFSGVKGGFGVDAGFANDVKNLLSSQQISSHVSLTTIGSIPSIKSNQVQIGVQKFKDFDPAAMMDKLATLANANRAEQDSVRDSATAARTGQQMISIRNEEIKSVMTGLGDLDDGMNKMLDINSLMSAFEDYIEKALAGNIGVPINYYLKPITAAQLAQMWVAKYFPCKFLSISGDDSESGNNSNSDNNQSEKQSEPKPKRRKAKS